MARKTEKADNHSDFSEASEALVSEELCLNPEPSDSPAISQRQLAANRANAQFSSAPRTSDGKQTSSLNAVKTALTGRTVLLSSDDAARYERHLAAYGRELAPVDRRECDLAQSIADSSWRLLRIPGLEMAIFAQGSVEFADTFEQHDPALRASMIELQTLLAYEKQLRNLQLQEARLHRRREKDTAELNKLQQARQTKQVEALEAAAAAPNGFEFSTAAAADGAAGLQACHAAVPGAISDSDYAGLQNNSASERRT